MQLDNGEHIMHFWKIRWQCWSLFNMIMPGEKGFFSGSCFGVQLHHFEMRPEHSAINPLLCILIHSLTIMPGCDETEMPGSDVGNLFSWPHGWSSPVCNVYAERSVPRSNTNMNACRTKGWHHQVHGTSFAYQMYHQAVLFLFTMDNHGQPLTMSENFIQK